jgi:hypothetical protein
VDMSRTSVIVWIHDTVEYRNFETYSLFNYLSSCKIYEGSELNICLIFVQLFLKNIFAIINIWQVMHKIYAEMPVGLFKVAITVVWSQWVLKWLEKFCFVKFFRIKFYENSSISSWVVLFVLMEDSEWVNLKVHR